MNQWEYQELITKELERNFQRWVHGRISNQTFKDLVLAKSKEYTMPPSGYGGIERTFLDILQELQSEQELR